ncbi:MAG: ABC transporter ATP-binding protein [Acidimicrobiales bacterium]|nr:ABC transporter ATP-binding protein [Acidimicrobiales bacterium]
MGPHWAIGSDPAAVKGKQIQDGTVRRVLGFARPYRRMLVGFVATILGSALLSLMPPLLFKRLIDHAIVDADRSEVHVLALLAVGVAIVDAALSLAERWWSSRIGEGLIYDLRVGLFDHVQRMPLAFFTRIQTGSLISRMNNDVIGAQRAMTGTLGQVVSNVIVLATTLIAMFVLEWRLTLLSLVLLPLFILPTKRVGRHLQVLTRESMNLNAAMNTTMTERLNVSGALLVKLFGRHDDERTDFADRAGKVRDIGVRNAMYGRTFFIALGLVGAVGTAMIYWIGGLLVIDGTITVGTLAAMSLFVTRIYTPLTSLTNARVDIMTALVSFERVFEVLDTPNPITDHPGAVDLVEPTGRVTFDHVGFTYPTAEGALAGLEAPQAERSRGPVLTDIDLDISPGELVAVVGPSGAGKSTLVSLVPRLYDVTEGSVAVDGTDVRRLSQASLRRAIGVVNQDPHLFHESVAANLRYARPDATDDELAEACRAARIHDVIAALPDGYDTLVGERGYRLSGGEKQRLAIARMLLKDPAVVILDEATSHLDSENEALVQQALATALEHRTAIVIAHRLSTIVGADRIIVIDDGHIVEQGRHDDLLARGGLYSDLYQTLVRDQHPDDLGVRP